jgi:SAM-dependent methyltransferase
MHHGYSRGTAAVYDRTVGVGYFLRARQRFERVMAAHHARFASAADIGCGTGLFACYLRDHWGVPVMAVDRSVGMLAEARARCGTRPGITLLKQDVRTLSLPRRVELVTANFDMLNHLARYIDLDSAVRAVAANLAQGGWFYFDLLTPCLPLDGFDAIVRRVQMPGTTFEQRAVWLPSRRLIGVQARIRTRRGTSTCQVAEWHIERAYGTEEIGRALRDAGFITRGVYDEATLGPARGCPARLIILAQKP